MGARRDVREEPARTGRRGGRFRRERATPGRDVLAGVEMLGAAVVVVGAAAAAVLLLGVHLARRAVIPVRRPVEDVLVHAVDPDPDPARAAEPGRAREPRRTITLSGPDTELPGRYSLVFDGGAGHARIGEVLDAQGAGFRTGGTDRAARGGLVRRELVSIDRGALRAGARGRVTGWWFTGPAELPGTAGRIRFPLEGGETWGWIVTPETPDPGRWAVHVHGRGALPEETLRGVAPLGRCGATSLVLAYRNDPGAPRGRAGRYGLGLAEQRDVDAAIAEAARRGATRVTLVGWSMGAAACLRAAARGPHRDLIDGMVLDSPALDWGPLLRYQARLAGAPAPLARLALWLLSTGAVRSGDAEGIDFDALDAVALAGELRVPTLVHVGARDTFVPETGALRFARARPDLVRLQPYAEGEHVKLWNVDPEPWERASEEFVAGLRAPAVPRLG